MSNDAITATAELTKLSTETARLRTTLELTHSLLAAISSPDPVRALTQRLSTLCKGSSIIYDIEGRAVASAGEAPTQLIWQEIVSTNQAECSFDIGRYTVKTRRVSLQAGVHVIAIASRGATALEQIGTLLLDAAEQLLGAVHGIHYGATKREQRDNEQLLAALHDGITPSREHLFWQRLTAFRFTPYQAVRAAVLAHPGNENCTVSDLEKVLGRARDMSIPLLVMQHRPDPQQVATLALLLPAAEQSDKLLRQLAIDFLVGVAPQTTTLSAIPQNVRETEIALDIARQWSSAATTPDTDKNKQKTSKTAAAIKLAPVYIDRLDLAAWLLSHTNTAQLRSRIATILAKLDPLLKETLISYFAHEQNITEAAEQLFVHPNTVRYRLSRVEEILGAPIHSPFLLTDLLLALHPEIVGERAKLLAGGTHGA